MSSAVYASDPDAAPDAEFVSGELRHLVVGNRGRLLDARRTPIRITALTPEIGAFELEISAFEDTGARWQLPLWDVRRFQFARDSAVAATGAVAELERAADRFDRELIVECDPRARADTLRRIAAKRKAIRARLAEQAGRIDLGVHVSEREGNTALFALLEEVMRDCDLTNIERHLSATFASNPGSGELVKGHAIVLAELGLCPYRGKMVRDPNLFTGPWSKARRAEHLVERLAFTQELWSNLGDDTVTLYRGAAIDGRLPPPSRSSFVSATFSAEIAAAHFKGGPTTKVAALWRQQVPISRLLATFLETREMTGRFNEAEAILIADSTNHAF